jgi:two-component system sensor histidine kinase KdpD
VAKRLLRVLLSLAGVCAVTLAAHSVARVNATTVGFAYLLLVLVIATTWGFVEASAAALAATLAFNFFFMEPIGKLTIADPQNWVALFSFLATALIASRLSAKAARRTLDAIERRQDVEHLYTFSRAILLIDGTEPFPKQLAQRLADSFQLNAVVLYSRRSGEFFRGGPDEFEGMEDQLKEAASHGASFWDPERNRVITAVRLGAEPIAALALQGAQMPDAVLQGIANLVAIGLERAAAQDLAHQIEAARRIEQLRTTLIDAMAHEFKTPLTSIKAATTSLLASPEQPLGSRTELLTIADEEADHLRELIDDSVEMARLENSHFDVHAEPSDLVEVVRAVVDAMQSGMEDRKVELICDEPLAAIPFDRRLVKLATKQLLDNALKYSPVGTPVSVRVGAAEGGVAVEVTNRGAGIPAKEQARVFERFYRSPSVKQQVPGSGLGLSIAYNIAQAHHGELTVKSSPGATTFRMTLPDQTQRRPG